MDKIEQENLYLDGQIRGCFGSRDFLFALHHEETEIAESLKEYIVENNISSERVRECLFKMSFENDLEADYRNEQIREALEFFFPEQ